MDGVEKYGCINYKKKRKATKRLQIHGSPNVLIISLKCFDLNNDKIDKKVSFPMELDIAKYCHVLAGTSIPKYNLVSLIKIYHSHTVYQNIVEFRWQSEHSKYFGESFKLKENSV